MHTIKLTSIGTSTGAIIPKEVLTRMNLEKGDILHIIETPEGLLLTPYDPDFDTEVEALMLAAKKFPNTMKKLAK